MGKILLVISILAILGFNSAGLAPVFATSHCYQPQSGDGLQIQGEGVLPTFGPTCAVAPSPQPTATSVPPQPTSPPKGGPPPTSPPTPTPPVSGNMAVTATVFIGGVLFILLGVSFSFLKAR